VPKSNIVRPKHNENTHVRNFTNVTVNTKIGTKGDSEIISMHLLYCKMKAQRIDSCTSTLAIRQSTQR